MPKSRAKRRPMAAGCMMLFALPFAAVGVGMACWTAYVALKHTAMQSWVEVPAHIRHVELQRIRGEDSVKLRAVASYDYEFEGQSFQGERVGLHTMSDNAGSFQQDAYQELKRHHDSGKPFRAYVNPSNPAEAVLYRQLRWPLMVFFTAFATIFGCVGLGMFTGAVVAARRGTTEPIGDVPAGEPWRARPDWASGQIGGSTATAASVPVFAVVALWWFVASAPLLFKLPALLQESQSAWRWVMLVFPVIGILLVGMLAYETMRRRKFGESVLQLASTPGVVGGQLAGVVRIPQVVQSEHGFRVKLSCIARATRERDNDTHEEVIWQDERIVAQPMRDIAAGATVVPVLFAIPYQAQETCRWGASSHIEWRLEVSARMPGVDYKSRFEVPVFKTPASRADFKLDESLAADYVVAPRRELVLREAGISMEPLAGGGVRLVFPAARNVMSAIIVTAFLVAWSATIGFMLRFDWPIIFPIVFGLFELLLIWLAVDLWFYRSVVEARSDGLTFRGGLLGIGRKRIWPADEVQRFTASESMSTGTSIWKNVDVVLHGRKNKTIAKTIGSKSAHQAVIDELNAALRRGPA